MKNMLLAVLAALVLFFSPATLSAQSPDAQRLLAGLSARYSGLNSLSAHYKRVAFTPSSEQLFKSSSSQTAAGRLSWLRPDKLLLDQTSPGSEIMVTDGSTVWWYIEAEKLAYRYQDMDVAGQLRPLMSFLGGLDSLNSDFTASSVPAKASRSGELGLSLLPKKTGGSLQRLVLWCDASFSLTGFDLYSPTGERTEFFLSQVRENPKLKANLFSFKPPRGTDIVEGE